MIFNQRYTLPAAAIIAVILSIASFTHADRVILTKPANGTDVYAGCPVDLGFRVQYSDLAMLRSVQFQIRGANDSVLIDSLGSSARAEWGDTHVNDVSWTVPSDWTDGDYIVRAFGNATYPCIQNGHHTRCSLVLEDRETVHVKTLDATHQECPSVTQILMGRNNDTIGNTTLSIDGQKSDLDVSMNLNDSHGKNDTSIGNNSNATVSYNMTDTEIEGIEGSSTRLHIVLDQATVERIQEQTIRRILNDTRDYNLINTTVTLVNGTVVPMGDLMDNSTSTRFIQALEIVNATLTSNNTGMHVIGTTELIEALHKNSSLIQAPLRSTSNSTLSFVLDRNSTIGQSGQKFVQQEDVDQIQDKSNNAIRIMSALQSSQLYVATALIIITGAWMI